MFSLRQPLSTLFKAIKHFAVPQRRLGTDEPTADELNAKDLLPSRNSLLPDLRPGRHHREIHDPRYLKQILSEDLKTAKPPETP